MYVKTLMQTTKFKLKLFFDSIAIKIVWYFHWGMCLWRYRSVSIHQTSMSIRIGVTRREPWAHLIHFVCMFLCVKKKSIVDNRQIFPFHSMQSGTLSIPFHSHLYLAVFFPLCKQFGTSLSIRLMYVYKCVCVVFFYFPLFLL